MHLGLIRKGPRNHIGDIGGILVGDAEDEAVRTGVTVVLPEARAVAACDVRGGGPGRFYRGWHAIWHDAVGAGIY